MIATQIQTGGHRFVFDCLAVFILVKIGFIKTMGVTHERDDTGVARPTSCLCPYSADDSSVDSSLSSPAAACRKRRRIVP